MPEAPSVTSYAGFALKAFYTPNELFKGINLDYVPKELNVDYCC
jgi:hypothetical protein